MKNEAGDSRIRVFPALKHGIDLPVHVIQFGMVEGVVETPALLAVLRGLDDKGGGLDEVAQLEQL